MLVSVFQLMISIYSRDRSIFPTTVLAFTLPMDQWVMTINNEVIDDIPCYLLCFSWWFLSRINTDQDIKQLCVCCWPSFSMPCPTYDVIGFQPPEVDIPDLGYVYPPPVHFQYPPVWRCMSVKRRDGKRIDNEHMEGHQFRRWYAPIT